MNRPAHRPRKERNLRVLCAVGIRGALRRVLDQTIMFRDHDRLDPAELRAAADDLRRLAEVADERAKPALRLAG